MADRHCRSYYLNRLAIITGAHQRITMSRLRREYTGIPCMRSSGYACREGGTQTTVCTTSVGSAIATASSTAKIALHPLIRPNETMALLLGRPWRVNDYYLRRHQCQRHHAACLPSWMPSACWHHREYRVHDAQHELLAQSTKE